MRDGQGAKGGPAPVYVHFFPKKQGGASEAVTQPVPVAEPPKAARPKRKKVAVEAQPPPKARVKASPKQAALARSVLTAKDPKRAARALSKASLNELFGLAHRLFEAGSLTQARRLLEPVTQSKPDDAFPFTLLGATYLAQGEDTKALPMFEAALDRDRGDWAARVYRAEVHLALGRWRVALAELQRVLEKGPARNPFVKRAKRLLAMAEKLAKKAARSP
jgi:predicted Zn-dependent protease